MAKTYRGTPATYYSEHKRKQTIRSLWCKPHIELLYKNLNKKLIYIGLPDLKALDVLEWIDYLDKVIAFQCTEYKRKPINVRELENLLSDLERKNQLRSFVVYHGWMEEIVMGGLSKIGQIYNQNDFLKIYNLDFCNNFTTPAKVRDQYGNIIDIIYKSEAISKLLEYQKKSSDENKGSRFIMYLTVNSDTFEEDLSLIKEVPIKNYINQIKQITKPEVLAVRRMKAFCYYKIKKVFQLNDFHAEFLPPVFYFGSEYPNRAKRGKLENHRMMTFTILGTRRNKGEDLFIQDDEAFLKQQFIFANDSKISCFVDKFVDKHFDETEYTPNVLQLLSQSHTFKNLWKN